MHRYVLTNFTETTKQIPRYLFRMWHENSGGDAKLNTIDKVTPLAFLEGNGHENVYDMSIKELVDNTTEHLRGYHIATEFSSWSASLRFVLHYATTKRDCAYIAVIDTLGLQTDSGNGIFYVPALAPIFQDSGPGCDMDYGIYDWEFLVHGIVEGRHYKACSFKLLCEHGLLEYLPSLAGITDAWDEDRFSLSGPTVPFTVQELGKLTKIAELFEPQSNMRAAITITLFCCKKRVDFGSAFVENELDEIVQHLGGRDNVPHEWCGSHLPDKSIFDRRYEDHRQMLNCMRAVSDYCWGRKVKGRDSFIRRYGEKWTKRGRGSQTSLWN